MTRAVRVFARLVHGVAKDMDAALAMMSGAAAVERRGRSMIFSHSGRHIVNRRGILQSILAAAATAFGTNRLAAAAVAPAQSPAVAPTKHIRLYVEMDVAPNRERELLDLFHNQFVPEAVKHEGYIRVKMLKRRTILQGTAPANHNYRFELEFESEELRQKWIASDAHQRVWPPVEKTMTTLTGYPVVLYDEV